VKRDAFVRVTDMSRWRHLSLSFSNTKT